MLRSCGNCCPIRSCIARSRSALLICWPAASHGIGDHRAVDIYLAARAVKRVYRVRGRPVAGVDPLNRVTVGVERKTGKGTQLVLCTVNKPSRIVEACRSSAVAIYNADLLAGCISNKNL